MPSPEWLIERGIGETRAIVVRDGTIVDARIELDGTIPEGSVIKAQLANVGTDGRNAVAVGEGGIEYLLPRGAPGASHGATIAISVTRAMIPGSEPWKRALARLTDEQPSTASPLLDRLNGSATVFPGPRDDFGELGWDDLLTEARSGIVRFAGGELRIFPTPAMTLIDVDGYLAPEELAIMGAAEAARTIRRLDIGGSIGIDLPTSNSKEARQKAADALDAGLPKPFERTAVNGFGFVQIVRPRTRASLIELARDRSAFEARALLRRAAFDFAGAKTLVANPLVITSLEQRPDWLDILSKQLGGAVRLRADPALTMSAGYAEAV